MERSVGGEERVSEILGIWEGGYLCGGGYTSLLPVYSQIECSEGYWCIEFE